MTNDRQVKLKFASLALTLALAATLARGVSAQDADTIRSGDAKGINSGTQSSDSSSGENAAGASGGANTEGIDTRMSVRPHGPASKSGKFGEKTNTLAPLKLINAHRRTFSPSRAAHHVIPNPSGISAGPRQNLQPRPGGQFESGGVKAPPEIGTAGAIGRASTGLAKPDSNVGGVPLLPSGGTSGAGAKPFTRGSIGGTASNHHSIGMGTAGIGGPAHTVTGINGTLIRESR